MNHKENDAKEFNKNSNTIYKENDAKEFIRNANMNHKENDAKEVNNKNEGKEFNKNSNMNHKENDAKTTGNKVVFVQGEEKSRENNVANTVIKDLKEKTNNNILGGDERKSSYTREFLAACAASSLLLATGAVTGWSSPGLPSLQQDPIFQHQLTDTSKSWIGSCLALGNLLFSPLIPPLLPSLGPKRTLLFVSLPCFLLGFLLLLLPPLTPSLWLFYSSRLVSGFGMVSAQSCLPSYIMGVSSPWHRGQLGVLGSLAYRLGLLIITCLGSFLDWWWIAFSSLVLLLPFILTFPFVPDSPASLAARGRVREADLAREWLGQAVGSQDGGKPLKAKDSVENGEKVRLKERISSLTKPGNLRPIVLSVFLCSSYQLSGIAPITFFKIQFFQDAGSSMDPYVSSVILAAINLLTVIIVSVSFTDPSRRLMILISQAGVSLCLSIIAIYFFLKDVQQIEGIGWLPLVAMIGLFVFFNIGISSFVWFVIAEILPASIRSFVYPVIMFEGSLNFFLATSSFKYLFLNLGGCGIFLFYAASSSILLVVFYFFLPETKGKLESEIADCFTKSVKSRTLSQS